MSLWVAAVLGLVEGLTEYLPVSSTGHLVLVSHLLGLHDETSKSFDIVIQLGAILAVLIHYRTLLAQRVSGLFQREPKAVTLFSALVAGFIPAAVVGLLLRNWIKAHLFGDATIAWAFIIGGIVMIGVESWRAKRSDKGLVGLEHVTAKLGLIIGLGQCVSLIPGASRSMSTIVTGQLCGLSTATAAEFSFLLGLPTLGAATLYEGFKARHELIVEGTGALIVGLLVSFFVAWAVIAAFLRYLQSRGLAPFGFYRIVVGVLVLFTLAR
jgi:undecaprenyl-diphosphatase